MKLKIKQILSPGSFQLSMALILLIFMNLYQYLNLPEPVEIVETGKNLLMDYGLVVLILAAFVESLFMLSIYFPGSLVILTSVVVSDKSFSSLSFIAIYSLIGFCLGYIVNYILGKEGLYRFLMFLGKKSWIERMQIRLEKNLVKTLFLTSFHPNFLSIAIVCLGISKVNIFKSIGYSVLFSGVWITIWMISTVPILNSVEVNNRNFFPFVILGFTFWGIFNIIISKAKSHFNRH